MHLTYLENTHAVGVTEDLVRLIVVAVADVCSSDEELEWIIIANVHHSSFDLLLELLHTLLSMTANILMKHNTFKLGTLVVFSFLLSTFR